MSDELLDPREEFLSAAALPAPVATTAEGDSSHQEIALALAAGFMAYRLWARDWLLNQGAPGPDREQATVDALWLKSKNVWLNLTLSAITRAYDLGAVGNAPIAPAVREAMATEYATNLGAYLHTTSANALLDGFHAQLSAGWNERVAWERAANGYGLDGVQMRSWLFPQLKTIGTYQTSVISEAARRAVDKLLLARAARLGDNEGYHALQVGRALSWMYAQATGDLPDDAQKMWVTAQDERVCALCGPLDQVAVPLSAQFMVGDTGMWAPGAHPRCRCTVVLAYGGQMVPDDLGDLAQDLVTKNMPGDPYDRKRNGQFARREERRTATLEQPLVDADAMLAEAKAAQSAPADPFAKPADPFANPFLKTDPFVKTDPFAASKVDPFTSAKPDPFTKDPFTSDPFAKDPFTGRTKGSKRLLRRVVLIDGKRRVQEEEVTLDEDMGFYQNTVYMSGDAVMADYEEMRRNSYDGTYIPAFELRPGAILNLDLLSTPEPGSRTGLRMPMSVSGYYNDRDDHQAFKHMMEADLEEGRIRHEMLLRTEAAYDMVADEMQDVYSTLDGMHRLGLIEIAEKAVENGLDPTTLGFITEDKFKGVSDEALLASIVREYRRSATGSPVRTAVEEYLLEEALEYIDYNWDSSMEEDTTPIVFKFEGWMGGHTDAPIGKGNVQAILEGEYVVDRVVTTRVDPKAYESLWDDELPYDQIRIVTLRPRNAT